MLPYNQTTRDAERLIEKYRPRKFEDILGQYDAVQWCVGQVRSGGGRSVILYGSSGTGKTTTARIYARGLLCHNSTAANSPCGVCESCQSFERKEHPPDYIELHARRVDQVEEVLKTLDYCSWRGGR